MSGLVTGEGPCLLTVLDISESKKAEESLMASETRYRKIFESAREGILILDAETGLILDVNWSLTEMLGYSKAIFISTDRGHFLNVNAMAVQMLGFSRAEMLLFTIADISPPWRLEEYYHLLDQFHLKNIFVISNSG